MNEFLVYSPVKINFTLRITGKKADGYHSLASGVLKIRCGEMMRFLEPSSEDEPFSEDSVCTRNYSIEGTNILIRALEALRKKDTSLPFQQIVLEKIIPPGTGVGGGSGNLASFLDWIRRRYGIFLEDSEIAALGADVPFLHSPHRWAFLTGIGEKIEPLHMDMDYVVVLSFPSWSSNTHQAYEDLDQRESAGTFSWSSEASAREEMFSLLRKLRRGEICGLFPNDFLEVLPFRDSYASFFSLASSQGALGWGVSGSGSSMFAIYPRTKKGEPEKFKTFLQEMTAFSWIQKTLYLESW